MEVMSATNPAEGKPGLILAKLQPENMETPLNVLNTWVVPNELFYIRNHFLYPNIDLATWSLTIGGQVNRQLSLNYEQLSKMPQVSKHITFECAGNKRSFLEPPVSGEQYGIGAVGNAKWTGVSLSYLLDQAGIGDGVKELIFTGADFGQRPDMTGVFNYQRSLPFQKELLSECLLALKMNDQPLPFKHGAPVRLVVPGWYAMANVKWLTGISASVDSFQGPFQAVDYVYLEREDDYKNAVPVTTIKINSVITWPSKGEVLKPGVHVIKGLAWTGKGKIAKVSVSTDDGTNWTTATLTSPEHQQYTWTFWEYTWTVYSVGHYSIMAKAEDSEGQQQPRVSRWNAKGYGNNMMHQVPVSIPGTPVLH
ncbi:MAG: sulfite oxidase [Negativicutes bacterium]|nr:sulfite oxidase [Negativicutes bacterium]